MDTNFFEFVESPYHGKYIIKPCIKYMPFPNGTKGSYMVLAARMMNLDYVSYLRYCRDVLGAELIGKNSKYVVPHFEKTELTKVFLEILNKRAYYCFKEQIDPYIYTEVDGKVVRTEIDFGE